MLGQSSLGENVHWTFSVAAESARGIYPSGAAGCSSGAPVAIISQSPLASLGARLDYQND